MAAALMIPYIKPVALNEFFNSTFTTSNYSLPSTTSLPTPTTHKSKIEIKVEDVYNGLLQLDPTKAMGCVQIHPMVLKLCADSLSYPLHNLFSSCLELGDIPSEWKIYKICPVPKSGDLLCVENYHPISLLCITGKVRERIVYDKIFDFIRPKISNHQHGFLQYVANRDYGSTVALVQGIPYRKVPLCLNRQCQFSSAASPIWGTSGKYPRSISVPHLYR